jgi:hypothetical protein
MSLPLPIEIVHPFGTSKYVNKRYYFVFQQKLGLPKDDSQLHLLAENVRHQLQWSSVSGSSLVAARLTLSGTVSEARFLSRRYEQVFTAPLSEWVFELKYRHPKPWYEDDDWDVMIPDFEHYISGTVSFDKVQEVLAAATTAYRVIHIAKYKIKRNPDTFTHFMLVIKPTSPGGQEYSRVGVAVVEVKKKEYHDNFEEVRTSMDLPGSWETDIHLV